MPWAVAGAAIAAGGAVYAADKQSDAANNAADAARRAGTNATASQSGYRQAGNFALDQLAAGFGRGPLESQDNFDSAAYLAANPDVARAGAGAWQHYNEYGKGEGRSFTYTPDAQSRAQAGAGGAGGGVDFNHQFNAQDLNSNLAPNYQFMLDQGQRANQNAAGVGGGLVGGNALQGLNQFTQGYAQNAYQQAFSNYTANQTNIYNRLSNLAGLGQTANQASANAGIQSTQNAGNFATSGAAAQAAGMVGAGNAINNGLSNYMGWQYLNKTPSGGGGNSSWGSSGMNDFFYGNGGSGD
jgi:hypothetical protein